jgi:hypothetical protein
MISIPYISSARVTDVVTIIERVMLSIHFITPGSG